MTDGTSQGLFVVVAIVIFGIFVALSYTVFGNDGLSDNIPYITQQHLRESTARLKNETYITSIRKTTITRGLPNPSGLENEVSFSPTLFEQDGEYTLEFDITLKQGKIERLGGHYHIGDISEVFVDSEHHTESHDGRSNPWRWGIILGEPFEVGETRRVVLNFKTDRYDNPTHSVMAVRIAPDRFADSIQYLVEISNLSLYKTN